MKLKKMKDNFKRMIDSMSDDEFLDFIKYINACTQISDEDDDKVTILTLKISIFEAFYYAFYFFVLYSLKIELSYYIKNPLQIALTEAY